MIKAWKKSQIIDFRVTTLLVALLSVGACQMPSHNSTPSTPSQSESSAPSTTTNSADTSGTPTNNSGSTPAESTMDLDQTLDQSLQEFDNSISNPIEVGHIDILTPSGNSEMQAGDTDFADQADKVSEITENADIAQRASSKSAQSENMDGNNTDSTNSPPQGTQSQASSVPEDIGDGRGDNIVERQIREAALNEKDPELREQLWNEYRKIKK